MEGVEERGLVREEKLLKVLLLKLLHISIPVLSPLLYSQQQRAYSHPDQHKPVIWDMVQEQDHQAERKVRTHICCLAKCLY